MRSDGSDSLIPVTRMPMGLIEYTICFFNANSIQQVCLHTEAVTVSVFEYSLFHTFFR